MRRNHEHVHRHHDCGGCAPAGVGLHFDLERIDDWVSDGRRYACDRANVVRSSGVCCRRCWQDFLNACQQAGEAGRSLRTLFATSYEVKLYSWLSQCPTHARGCYFYSSQAFIAQRLGMSVCRSASADVTALCVVKLTCTRTSANTSSEHSPTTTVR